MANVTLPTSLADVDANGTFKIAASGNYTLEVKKAEIKTSQAGNVMVNLGLQIVDDDEFSGTYVWDTLVMIESCMFKVKQFLLSAGLDAEVSDIDTDEWIGETVEAVVDTETYKNKNDDEVEKNIIKRYTFGE